MKNKSVATFIHIKESLALCDIWRAIIPKKNHYTFRQQHVIGFIQRRLDYFLVSNNLRESINKTDIWTALSTDHSPIRCIFDHNYLDYEKKLEQIYEKKTIEVKIRSNCEWYDFEEKSSKFFLNLEKEHAL